MISVTAKIDIADALKRLRGLPVKMQKKLLKEAVQAGGRVVRDRMRAGAPVSTDPRLIPDLLKQSQQTKVKVYRSSGTAVAITGAATNVERNKKTGKRQASAFGRRVAAKAAKLFARGRQLRLGAKQAPSSYAHLAGPGRKQRYATAAAQDQGGIRAAVMDVIRRGLEGA